MQQLQVKEVLRSLPFFRNLSGDQIEIIARIVKEEKFPARHIFISEKNIVQNVYFILSGSAQTYSTNEEGKEVSPTLKASGEIIGETALLGLIQPPARAETIEETNVLILPVYEFRQIIAAYPDITDHLPQTEASTDLE
jgi:CRP/FNR family transcriptional regulator, cyclic AMP receptor protein